MNNNNVPQKNYNTTAKINKKVQTNEEIDNYFFFNNKLNDLIE